jgi:hypothetical protein
VRLRYIRLAASDIASQLYLGFAQVIFASRVLLKYAGDVKRHILDEELIIPFSSAYKGTAESGMGNSKKQKIQNKREPEMGLSFFLFS